MPAPHPLRSLSFAMLAFHVATVSVGATTHAAPGRWLHVDPRNPEALPTLAAAVAQARAGDTLWLAPGSGPYREELFLPQSGTDSAPITVEGNGNEITGFDPLVFAATPPGVPRTVLVTAAYPFVLRHQGIRIPEDPVTRHFIASSPASTIAYDPASRVLTLGPDASSSGWEISTRQFVVRIQNASYHRYRNLVASGSRNDGVNLHGRGTHLIFENITGCHNLDEGFSAHDDIECEIREGRFFGNDNGLVNIQRSRTQLTDISIWQNLGIGLELHHEAAISADRLRIWGNGMRQFSLIGSPSVTGRDIIVHRNTYAARPWLTHMESAKQTQPPVTLVGDAARALAAAATITVSDTPSPLHAPTPQ